MYNSIAKAITRQLHTAWPNTPVYALEEMKQGINEPCFLVTMVSAFRDKVVGQLYRYDPTYAVQYFPSTSTPREECAGVLADLDDVLEYVTINYVQGNDLIEKKVRRTAMEGVIVDDVMTATVRYENFWHKLAADDLMEKAETEIALKGESNG